MQTSIQLKPYGYIYKITNPTNGKCYIGQTTRNPKRRWSKYKCLDCKGQIKLYNALKKYGPNNFTYEIIVTGFDKNNLDFLEDTYEIWCDSIDNGYNCKRGGANGKTSEETKRKISLSNKGRIGTMKGKHHTKQTLQLLSKIHTGMRHSKDTKLKIAKASMGRKHTDEAKQKISNTHKGKVKTYEHRRKISIIQRQRTIEERNKIQEKRKHNDNEKIRQFMLCISYIIIHKNFNIL